MQKTKALIICISLVLIAIAGLQACTCAQTQTPNQTSPTTPTEPSTPPQTPPTTAAEQPEEPAATPPPTATPAEPVEKPTSFEAEAYTNDQYGFSVKYPKGWVKKEVSGDLVFSAASGQDATANRIDIIIIPEVTDPVDFAKSYLDNTEQMKQYGAKAKVESSTEMTLADDKTPAAEIILSSRIVMFDVYFYCLGINKDGKSIAVMTTTIGGNKEKALMSEIAQTLSVK